MQVSEIVWEPTLE